MKYLLPFLLLVSIAANAHTFPFAALVEDDTGPVNGLVSVELRIVDGSAVVWSETQPAVIVVDGVMALDVGAANPLPTDVPPQAALMLVVEGDELSPLPLARLFLAQAAARAQHASQAAQTTVLNGSTAAEVATRAALGAAGGPPVAFGNISGVPAAIADGDQGTDVTSTSADFALSARTLSIATVSGSRLATASVQGSRLSGVVNGEHVADGTITSAEFAASTMTRAGLAADVSATETKTVAIFQLPAGCGSELSTSGQCIPTQCSDTNRLNCGGTACTASLVQVCLATAIGKLVVDQ